MGEVLKMVTCAQGVWLGFRTGPRVTRGRNEDEQSKFLVLRGSAEGRLHNALTPGLRVRQRGWMDFLRHSFRKSDQPV